MTEKPQGALIIAGGLLEKNGKFLLVNAKVGKPKGLWNLPGGRLEEGETVDEAAVREVNEETGVEAEIEGLVSIYHRASSKLGNIIRVIFKMNITGGELNPPEDEIEEARWFTLEEIKGMDAFKFACGTRECVLDYVERGFIKQNSFSTTKDVR